MKFPNCPYCEIDDYDYASREDGNFDGFCLMSCGGVFVFSRDGKVVSATGEEQVQPFPIII
jgi:hypothetical protein